MRYICPLREDFIFTECHVFGAFSGLKIELESLGSYSSNDKADCKDQVRMTCVLVQQETFTQLLE